MILKQQIATVTEVKVSDVYDYSTGKTEKKHSAKISWAFSKHETNYIMVDNNEMGLSYGDAVRIVITDVAPVTDADV